MSKVDNNPNAELSIMEVSCETCLRERDKK